MRIFVHRIVVIHLRFDEPYRHCLNKAEHALAIPSSH